MYLPGDYFNGRVLGEELELEIVASLTFDSDDYVIAEGVDGEQYVFLANNDDELEHVDDEELIEEILEMWESESLEDKPDIGDWDDDSYYDREDSRSIGDVYDDEDYEEKDY